MLKLEDLKNMSAKELRAHMALTFHVDKKEIEKYEILLAYESVGAYGCDSSCFYVLRGKKDGKLYEVNGSHCSCYGFGGQFEPIKTLPAALKRRNYYSLGGYDSDEEGNLKKIKNFINSL